MWTVDTQKPKLTEAIVIDSNHIKVAFNEIVNETESETISNYSINNSVSISSAVLQSDKFSVILTVSPNIVSKTIYTLSVSGISDVAPAKNMIDPASVTFGYTLAVTKTVPVKYEWGILNNGEKFFCDRDYTFCAGDWGCVPEEYKGLQYMRTANNDYGVKGDSVVSFEINKPAYVYICRDQPSANPAWMDGFTDTQDSIEGKKDYNWFKVYSKLFPAGKVYLGGNAGNSSYSNYFVILRSEDSSDLAVEGVALETVGEIGISVCPNPFNPVINISVNGINAQIAIYDIRGKLVKTLSNATTIQWNAQNHPSGIYIVRVKMGEKVLNKKIMLIR